jgi:uroporphyrinogen III methyltransferase/synthase
MTTRTARKPAGRIAFIGAGPGDPELLTRRAYAALTDADQVVYDRGVPDSLLSAIRSAAKDDAQFSPAEGAPGDVAKVLLSAAKSGLSAVHLVAGDPFGHDSVVKEVQAVARTAVHFEVIPGIGQAEGVAAYAGVPLPGVRVSADVDDVTTSTSTRSPRPPRRAPSRWPWTPATSPRSATVCSRRVSSRVSRSA